MLPELKYKKIRHREQKKLNESNIYLYKNITTYISNSSLRRIEKEEVLQQIMDMMLQSQMENQSIDIIVGDDYEEFCRSVIEEYSRVKSRTYKVLGFLQSYMVWMVLIGVFMVSVSKITGHILGITVSQLILVNMIALILMPLSKKLKQERVAGGAHRKDFLNDKKAIYGMAAMIVLMELSRLMLGKEILDYSLSLYALIPYIGLIFLAAGAIEAYKRISDKR